MHPLMTSWMKNALPQVANVIITKRDRVMAERLVSDCSRNNKVIAVVFMGGFEREWTNRQKQNRIKSFFARYATAIYQCLW